MDSGNTSAELLVDEGNLVVTLEALWTMGKGISILVLLDLRMIDIEGI